ncbi:MAG: D-alanyl-D-alanine carboxypeptidase [Verrucomicrobiales bacterium]|nr:D-alanyl-D-alanine carboxypeptidase [Verrucomicrobiales bacterium]HQW28495.1 serine hydrolase [Verrucomicrobiales bacterium]
MKVISQVLLWMTVFSGITMNLMAAESYLLVDEESGYILSEKNEETPRQVASLTKIATVIIVLEWLQETGGAIGQPVTVIGEAVSGGANPLNLKVGDRLPLESGLYAAMMASDNTSAYAIAAAIGQQMKPGTTGPDAVAVFVERMNLLATRLGLAATRFVNPHGLDGEGAPGTSTAADMARLAIHADRCPDFGRFCREKEHKVTFSREGRVREVTLINTNELVGSRGIDGMKTGTTIRAGQCLIVSAIGEVEVKGVKTKRRLIAVVLKSEDRFREAVLLLNQGWADLEARLVNGGTIDTNDRLLKEVK